MKRWWWMVLFSSVCVGCGGIPGAHKTFFTSPYGGGQYLYHTLEEDLAEGKLDQPEYDSYMVELKSCIRLAEED